jgi:hypothetical protein
MTTEQLKLILDAFATLTATGKEAFVWWLFADRVLGSLTVIICISIVAYVALRILTRAIGSRMEGFREQLGVDITDGILYGFRETRRQVFDLIEQSRAKK